MNARRRIEVWTDWGPADPVLMGWLHASETRGREVVSFEYADSWLASNPNRQLDPALQLYSGSQYPPERKENFAVFLDSCPDRWGRVLMRRREAQLARAEGRPERRLSECDYLLGVHDGHRPGALRFRVDGPFLDNNTDMAAPPWTSLRELEHASLQLERDQADQDPDYAKWLRMLISPGGSLGGARPKASVGDPAGSLWIAKFPSRSDEIDVGACEHVVHQLAQRAGVGVPPAQAHRLGSEHHTFLSKRFDRRGLHRRIHVASALTMLERSDGDDASDGASYLELADFLKRQGCRPALDLEQLFRRMAFFVCMSNADDHLRNHAFVMEEQGWSLAPAYDMNADPNADGLRLNISETDNAQDLDLVREVAPYFRVKASRATEIIEHVVDVVKGWRRVADDNGLSSAIQTRLARAFRVAEQQGLRRPRGRRGRRA